MDLTKVQDLVDWVLGAPIIRMGIQDLDLFHLGAAMVGIILFIHQRSNN